MLQKVNFGYRLLNCLTRAGRTENRLMSEGVVKQLSENTRRFSAGDFYTRKLADGRVMLKGYDPSSLTSDVTYIVDKDGAYSQIVRVGKDICDKLGIKRAKVVQQYKPSGLIEDVSISANGEKGSLKDLISSYLNM